MRTATPALQTFVDGWEEYQALVVDALRPLSAEQLALKPAAHQWALWQIAGHVAGSRMYWLCIFLQEEPEPALLQMFEHGDGWEDDESHPRSSAELADALERTWALLAGCLERWTPGDLRVDFQRTWRDGTIETRNREWVIWHLIEHDLHHGGEISSILGSNGLAAPDL
jgi:uncharacterized damage-inducible protein DinB